MALILCLEDSAGNDTNLEVKPDDDFATFLRRAKVKLGYAPNISDITEGKSVSLSDNLYTFLLEAEMNRIEEPLIDNLNVDNFNTDISNVEHLEYPGDSPFINPEDYCKEDPNMNINNSNINMMNLNNQYIDDSNLEDPNLDDLITIPSSVPNNNHEEIHQAVDEEYTEIEYLSEDDGELLFDQKQRVNMSDIESSLNHEKDDPNNLKNELSECQEEYVQMEYLEEDSDEPDAMDIEILDSSLEDEPEDDVDPKRKEDELNRELEDVENALSHLLKTKPQDIIEKSKKMYTKDELLDMLGSSPERNSDDDEKNLNSDESKSKSSKINFFKKQGKRGKEYLGHVKKNDTIFKKRREMMKGKRGKMDEFLVNGDTKLSSFDIAMLKRTVRQPIISLVKMTTSEIEAACSGVGLEQEYLEENASKPDSQSRESHDLYIDESRYLPSNYEDVDNEGVFDFMAEEMQRPNNDLLTERKVKNIFSPKGDKKGVKKKSEILKAVGGINKMMGVDKKFPVLQPPVKVAGKRGRPRKSAVTQIKVEDVKAEPYDQTVDSHLTYMESVVKQEPIDDGDDDYVPGQNVDWSKNKKSKEKYYCRMCGNSFKQLGVTISHALVHRVPGKAVFPCVLCAYGFTTYGELQKHMKLEHRKKKSPKKSLIVSNATPGISKTRGRKKTKYQPAPDVKIEIIDNEEVCEIEMLEEWLDEEEEDYLNPPEPIIQKPPPNVEMKVEPMKTEEQDIEAPFDELKEILNYDEHDFAPSGDEEWLLEECDEEAAKASDDSADAAKDKLIKPVVKKRGGRRHKFSFKCDVCLNSYASREILECHKCQGPNGKQRGSKGSHRCALCGQSFTTRRRLIYHRSFHQVELLDMKLTCTKCTDKKFTSEAELYDHINNEHNIDFTCSHVGCDKRFHLRSALRAHTRIHGKKSHQCNVCGKQFYDIHNLKEHNITHLAVKPFQCHICLKFLNRRSRLRMHLLSHESCPVENCVLTCKCCKMAFKDAADAEAHVLESDDCCNNILESYEGPELLNVLYKLEEDRNANKNLMDTLDSQPDPDPSTISQAESTVDDIVNETLAQNGIVGEPMAHTISSDQLHDDPTAVMLSGDESMKALLAEVGAVKLMLTEDGNVKEMLDDISTKRNDMMDVTSGISMNEKSMEYPNSLIQVVEDVKNMLTDDGAVMSGDHVDTNFLMDNVMSMKKEDDMLMGMHTDNLELIKASEECDRAAENAEEQEKKNLDDEIIETGGFVKKKQYTEEELLSQLKENTRNFITVVKIKMVFRCEYCEKAFHTKDALNTHRKCHEGLRNPFICNVCNAAFSTFARCTSHKTTHGFYKLNIEDDHREKSAQEVVGYESFPVIKYFLCQECNITFLHWTYLQVHRRHKHGQFVYYFNCRYCGEKFTDSWSLNSHRRKVHAETVNTKKCANTSYKCADCGEGYNKRTQLAKHRLEQHGDSTLVDQKNKPGPFVCSICHKMYHTKVGLDGHMRSHNGGVYLCDLCGTGFAHRTGLESHHKRVHLREQNYICRDCGQHFFSPGDLEIHRRSHTGEKPFPCDFCQMSFRTKSRRNEHHRTHTGERPYPCDICLMSFRRSNAMKNHRLTHTGERRYSCPHCPKLFHVHSNLKSHMRVKHPEEYVVLELKRDSNMHPSLKDALKIITDTQENTMSHDEIAQAEMLVLEDVIIEDESEGMLKQDGPPIMGYAYSPDNITDVGGMMNEQYDTSSMVNSEDSKVHLEIVSGTDHGQSLLYTVEEGTAVDSDMQLIEGEVRYTLVDDIGDDHKEQQFAIIDGDQFIKEENGDQESVYYT